MARKRCLISALRPRLSQSEGSHCWFTRCCRWTEGCVKACLLLQLRWSRRRWLLSCPHASETAPLLYWVRARAHWLELGRRCCLLQCQEC
jgi:hypothetical protein